MVEGHSDPHPSKIPQHLPTANEVALKDMGESITI